MCYKDTIRTRIIRYEQNLDGMAKSKIQHLIQKIQSIIGDEDSISKLERDLVKSYLRDLYELTEEIPITGSLRDTKSPELTSLKPEPSSQPRPIANDIEVSRENVKPLPRKEEPEEVVEPMIIQDSYIPNGKHENHFAQPKVEAKEDPVPQSMNYSRPEPITEVFRQDVPTPPQYESLFETTKTKELSDKLSRSPISDLNRAFSINDRLLIVSDLFGNDQLKFQETIDILNSKYSFGEAKSYLLRYIVDRFNWLDEEKSERAREFIKLVERRYLDH